MVYFIKFLFIILLFYKSAFAAGAGSAASSAPFQIKVFDVGQGNCVALKYKGKSILIDCGTTGMGYTASYSHKAKAVSKTIDTSGKHKEERAPKSTEEKSAAAAAVDSDELRSLEEVIAEMGDLEITPGRKLSHPSSTESSEDEDTTARDLFKASVIEEVKAFLGGKIHAVIVTHPDIDHYNLIPDIIDTLDVENIILGGEEALYTDGEFRKWLKRHTSRIRRVDGFYSSLDEVNSEIENALTLHPSVADENIPQIQILAMNASATRGRREKNADSIVLKVTYNDESILLPGDATKETWSNINPSVLKADYFLLSHHGASTHGSTTPELVEHVQPTAVIISAGKHTGHAHPKKTIIEMLLQDNLLETADNFSTFVSYFTKSKKHRRIRTESLLFTTLNNGTITIDLGASTTHTTHSKTPKSYNFGDKSFIVYHNCAFKEQSASTPDDDSRSFSTLIKEALEADKVCFFKESTSEESSDLVKDPRTQKGSSCVYNFLIKKKPASGPEIVYLLEPISETADSEEATSAEVAAGGGKAAIGDYK